MIISNYCTYHSFVITQMECTPEYVSIDGSVWSEGRWGLNVSVTVRKIKCTDDDGGSSSVMTVEHLLSEMDQLRLVYNQRRI